MKYIKHYNTIAQATADTTAFSPFVGYCNEVGSPIYLGGGINAPVRLINNGIYGLGVNLYIITGGTWDANISGNKIKVQIEGDVTLNGKVDCYSIEFGTNGHLTINPDARLRIWEGGIVNEDAEMIQNPYITMKSEIATSYFNEVIVKYGEFLLHPSVTVNNKPMAIVDYMLYAGMTSSTEYVWHRFSTLVIVNSKPLNNSLDVNPTYMNGRTKIATWGKFINESTEQWNDINAWTEIQPFKAASLCNNTDFNDSKRITYTFINRLVGNENFTHQKLNNNQYFSNSYTGKIKTQCLLDIYNHIHIWPVGEDSYIEITSNNVEQYPYILPSTFFVLQSSSNITLSYKDFVWDPSFEEDEETTPTRGGAKGGSSPKYEPIDPKDMPQVGVPGGFGKPIEENNQR